MYFLPIDSLHIYKLEMLSLNYFILQVNGFCCTQIVCIAAPMVISPHSEKIQSNLNDFVHVRFLSQRSGDIVLCSAIS